MFDQRGGPRIYGMPPGADFPACLVSGLRHWGGGRAPDALGRVTLFVNTRRMARRIEALFDQGPPVLLPRIRLIGAIGQDTVLPGVPEAVAPLRRKLEIARLVSALIAADPAIAPRSAVYDLAESLAALLDEMQGEGVGADALARLDVTDQSGHWARSLKLLEIVNRYLAAQPGLPPDTEARRALAVAHLKTEWTRTPPGPVIVAGSTGSRGTTAEFMQLVAGLPDGALVLPGFDFDMPDEVWDRLQGPKAGEDHPQARYGALLARLGRAAGDVRRWPGAGAPDGPRNRLVSLALRPAPVTDRWLEEGPALGDLAVATRGLGLIQATSPRAEARAIAAAMREAVEAGRRVALVSPDRMLTRRVAAHLDRWDILADDSAGQPLSLSPPGRFLVQVGRVRATRIAAGPLLALLKHPLANSGSRRGPHLRLARELELALRADGRAFPTGADILSWEARRRARDAEDWARWLSSWLEAASAGDDALLTDRLAGHLRLAEALARGLDDDGSGGLWDKDAGQAAWDVVQALMRDGDAAGALTETEYRSVFEGVLAGAEVRSPEKPRADVMIWGTLEARVQGADLVILGGLNDGIWPALPSPDPWLNRPLRKAAGMLLPERRIGLSAHDFQQAAAAGEVILSRSVKSDDAQTVPSRWLNRLTNLLSGLQASGGPEALEAMVARGARWLELGAALERPLAETPPAPRPAPQPPREARPRKLPVTAIQRLIRDPYAIYARYVLNLRKLRPIAPEPDALLRGNVVHTALRRFMEAPGDRSDARLMELLDAALAEMVPRDLNRALWRARFAPLARWFVAEETARGGFDSFLKAELEGGIDLHSPAFRLTAVADRIDMRPDGTLVIMDYKTGKPPSPKEIEHFDKQLLLEAVIAEEGGFPDVPAAEVAEVVHVGLGSDAVYRPVALTDTEKYRFATGTVRAGLIRRVAHLLDPEFGFSARVAVQNVRFEGDYDHLSRFGEWDGDARAVKEPVG